MHDYIIFYGLWPFCCLFIAWYFSSAQKNKTQWIDWVGGVVQGGTWVLAQVWNSDKHEYSLFEFYKYIKNIREILINILIKISIR